MPKETPGSLVNTRFPGVSLLARKKGFEPLRVV